MKRTPMPKRRAAGKRRTTTPRCTTLRCTKPQKIRGMCVTHAERRADRLFSLWVRERDGRCMVNGALKYVGPCNGGLQAMHIIGRRNHTTRYMPQNVWSGCAGHHVLIDQHGREHAKVDFAVAMLGGKWDVLRAAAGLTVKRTDAIEAALSWLTEGET